MRICYSRRIKTGSQQLNSVTLVSLTASTKIDCNVVEPTNIYDPKSVFSTVNWIQAIFSGRMVQLFTESKFPQ